MDWFPLYNSLRIALIASVIVFFAGIFAAYYIAKLPPAVKGVLDVVLTLPLVLPPTVVGYFLLMLMGPRRPFGAWVLETFGTKMVMTWYSGICKSIGRVWCHQYDSRLYPRQDCHNFDNGLSVVADRQRCPCI